MRQGQNAYHSTNARPLAISNTDKRILASACRFEWEQLAGTHVLRRHRGFLPKRPMLADVVETDHLAHTYAPEHDNPAVILYDFTAAFPSFA